MILILFAGRTCEKCFRSSKYARECLSPQFLKDWFFSSFYLYLFFLSRWKQKYKEKSKCVSQWDSSQGSSPKQVFLRSTFPSDIFVRAYNHVVWPDKIFSRGLLYNAPPPGLVYKGGIQRKISNLCKTLFWGPKHWMRWFLTPFRIPGKIHLI